MTAPSCRVGSSRSSGDLWEEFRDLGGLAKVRKIRRRLECGKQRDLDCKDSGDRLQLKGVEEEVWVHLGRCSKI